MTSRLGRREFHGLGAAACLLGPAWSQEGEQVIPFLDSKPLNPERPTLPWEQTTSWITPQEHFF